MYYIVNQTFDLFSIPRTTPASAAILVCAIPVGHPVTALNSTKLCNFPSRLHRNKNLSMIWDKVLFLTIESGAGLWHRETDYRRCLKEKFRTVSRLLRIFQIWYPPEEQGSPFGTCTCTTTLRSGKPTSSAQDILILTPSWTATFH